MKLWPMEILYLNNLDVKTIADCPLIEGISYFYVFNISLTMTEPDSGLTQQDLSEKFGLKNTLLSMHESGKRYVPVKALAEL